MERLGGIVFKGIPVGQMVTQGGGEVGGTTNFTFGGHGTDGSLNGEKPVSMVICGEY